MVMWPHPASTTRIPNIMMQASGHMGGAHHLGSRMGPLSYLGGTGYLDGVPVPVFVEPMHGRALVPTKWGPPMTALFNASRVVTNVGLVYKVCAGVIQSLFLIGRRTPLFGLVFRMWLGEDQRTNTMKTHVWKRLDYVFKILLVSPHFIVNTLHPKVRTINPHNVTHSLISPNPRERMFVVQVSLLIIVQFLSLISQNLSLMQTTKEVHPHPRIATCVNMWSVIFLFFLFLFFFFLYHLLDVGACVGHIAREGQVEWTALA